MSAPILILLFSILVSIAGVTALCVGLFQQGKRIFRAGMAFAETIAPVADEISAAGERAAQHSAGMAERIAAIRS